MSEQQTAGADGGETQQQTGEQGKGAGSEKTFTQAELDAIVQARIKRERDKLGDVDDLRRKAEQFDQLQESQKSELQKASDAVAREKDRADKAEKALTDSLTRFAVTTAATKAGFHDPEDAYRFLDPSDLELDSDGTPKNLDKVLGALAKSKPHLVKTASVGNGSADGGPQGQTDGGSPGQTFGDLVAQKLGQ